MLLLVASFSIYGSSALAASPPSPPLCSGYVGVTNKIVQCIRHTLDSAAGTYFTNFYPKISNIITAVLTLTVLVYGVKLSVGLVERVSRDTVILLFKIAAVVAFTSNSDELYAMSMKALDSSTRAIVKYTPPAGPAYVNSSGNNVDYNQAECMQRMIKAQNAMPATTGALGAWLGMDCLIDSVIGIRIPDTSGGPPPTDDEKYFNEVLKATNQTTARSYIYLFFGTMQSSVMGLVLAIAGAILIFGLLMLIIKALFVYIAAMIGLALMIMISPMFIPMILFTVTKPYFDKWLGLCISFLIQPIVLMVFIVVSLTAVDFAVFSGEYSIVYRIAGKAVRPLPPAPPFDLNDYLTALRLPNGTRDPCQSQFGVCIPDPASKSILSPNAQSIAEVQGFNPGFQANAANSYALTADATKKLIQSFQLGGMVNGLANDLCTKDNKDANPDIKQACSDFMYPLHISLLKIDWNLMAKARVMEGNVAVVPPAPIPPAGPLNENDYGRQIARELLAATIFAAVVIFVLQGVLSVVPFMAQDLLGDFMQTPNIMAMGKSIMPNSALPSKFTSMAEGFKKQSANMIKGK